MRIGLDGRCIQDHFPGIGRYAYNLARALAELPRQDDLAILSQERALNTRFDLSALDAQPGVQAVPMNASVFSLRQQIVLPRRARALGLDLYHSPYYMMPWRMPCPTIVTIHDLIPVLHPEALLSRRRAKMAGLFLIGAAARAHGILVDSYATWADLERVVRGVGKLVQVAPLGVEARFRPASPEEAEAFRDRLGLRAPFLLHLGGNKPHKNLERLVRAWARVRKAVRGDWTLVLAGAHDERFPQVREAVARARVGASVRFLGPVLDADLPLLYGASEAFVFPSLYEGFGLPALEAMACGAPVACSERASLPEVVGPAALFFDPERTSEMADALTEMMSDAALRGSLRAKGLARAVTFSWQRTAMRTLDFYHAVADRRSVASP